MQHDSPDIQQHRDEEVHLLQCQDAETEMEHLGLDQNSGRIILPMENGYSDEARIFERHSGESELRGVHGTVDRISSPDYRVYKRRWFGLVQLVLLNIIVSWDVSYQDSSSPFESLQLNMTTFSGCLIHQLPTPQQPFSLPLLASLIGSALVFSSPS